MSNTRDSLLIRYQYDALDRLVSCTLSGRSRVDRLYQKDRLTTEIQGSVQRQIFQCADMLLAELQQEETRRTSLLMTDKQRSVLQTTDGESAYTPYGHRPVDGGLASLLGFNGERPDPITGHYLLGNGHRAFNPVLMRFNNPDSLSPFGKGGLNGYAYCQGDPVNRSDPTGKSWSPWGWFGMAVSGVTELLVTALPKSVKSRMLVPIAGHPTFGKAALTLSKASAGGGAVLFLTTSTIDLIDSESPAYQPLFILSLALAGVSLLSTTALVLHKVNRPHVKPVALSGFRMPGFDVDVVTPGSTRASRDDIRRSPRLQTTQL